METIKVGVKFEMYLVWTELNWNFFGIELKRTKVRLELERSLFGIKLEWNPGLGILETLIKLEWSRVGLKLEWSREGLKLEWSNVRVGVKLERIKVGVELKRSLVGMKLVWSWVGMKFQQERDPALATTSSI